MCLVVIPPVTAMGQLEQKSFEPSESPASVAERVLRARDHCAWRELLGYTSAAALQTIYDKELAMALLTHRVERFRETLEFSEELADSVTYTGLGGRFKIGELRSLSPVEFLVLHLTESSGSVGCREVRILLGIVHTPSDEYHVVYRLREQGADERAGIVLTFELLEEGGEWRVVPNGDLMGSQLTWTRNRDLGPFGR